jgi:CheY-like chemotaxis protein
MVEYSVLIVDDDIWMQRILSKTLQSYGFTKTFLASNGFEGIALAVEHLPSLIILDILMPELSGHLTLKILKHITCTKTIPVLMVSALSDVENLGLAVKYGTSGFISKPFTRATVYEKLASIFGRDELELIAKGEPIGDIQVETIFDKITGGTEYSVEKSEEQPIPVIEAEDIDSSDNAVSKPHVTQDQLMQYYQDDEKKSIESIKKLLLKSRK